MCRFNLHHPPCGSPLRTRSLFFATAAGKKVAGCPPAISPNTTIMERMWLAGCIFVEQPQSGAGSKSSKNTLPGGNQAAPLSGCLFTQTAVDLEQQKVRCCPAHPLQTTYRKFGQKRHTPGVNTFLGYSSAAREQSSL